MKMRWMTFLDLVWKSLLQHTHTHTHTKSQKGQKKE